MDALQDFQDAHRNHARDLTWHLPSVHSEFRTWQARSRVGPVTVQHVGIPEGLNFEYKTDRSMDTALPTAVPIASMRCHAPSASLPRNLGS